MTKDVLLKARRAAVKSFASLRAMALLCLVMLSVVSAKAQATVYALWCADADNPTLIFTTSNESFQAGGNFYYEGDKFTITQVWSGEEVTNTGNEDPAWLSVVEPTVKRVVITSNFSVALPKSTYHWFYGFDITAIDGLRYLNTSKVTNMEGMFGYCTQIPSLDLSYFDTRNVENMKDMFKKCLKLTSLDVSAFNTAKVTNMAGMFDTCTNLASLDLSCFDTSSVTDMHSMFSYTYHLNTLNLTSFNTSQVTDMSNMFEGSNVQSIDLSHFDTHNVTKMARMFAENNFNGSLDLSHFDTSNVTTMYEMFMGCRLQSLNLSSFDTRNVTDMTRMFYMCSHLEELDLKSFHTGKLVSMKEMFAFCNDLKRLVLENFDTSLITDMSNLFYDMADLQQLDLSSFNTSNVTTMENMFHQCYTLKSLDLSSFDTQNVTNMTGMFSYCSNLKTIYVSDESWTVDNVTETNNSMFESCENLIGQISTRYSSEHTGTEYARIDDYGTPGYLSSLSSLEGPFAYWCEDDFTIYFTYEKLSNGMYQGHNIKSAWQGNQVIPSGEVVPAWSEALKELAKGAEFDATFALARPTSTYRWFAGFKNPFAIIGLEYLNTSCVTTMKEMFMESGIDLPDLSSLNTRNVTDMSRMFYNCPYLRIVNLSGLSNSNVTDMSSMFENCTKLESINLSNFSAGKASMKKMFKGCTTLTELDMSTVNTSNATDMSGMFQDCTRLTSVDFSGMDVRNVTSMKEMFKGAFLTSYVNLDLSSFVPRSVTDMSSMFEDCTFLESVDVSNFDTDNVLTMKRMFYNCGQLKTLDLSNFNNSNVTDMDSLFTWCYGLETLNLRGFKTPAVTSMNSMFLQCGKLDSLDLSTFDTRNVTDMANMFYGCNDLTNIDLSSFNTSKVTTMKYMFFDNEKLTHLNLSNFDTRNVTNMEAMFRACYELTSLDLNSFDVSKVSTMNEMFIWCPNLTTIFCKNSWKTYSDNISSSDMFLGCYRLTGSDGTTYDENHTDISYAHLDGEGGRGYFSDYMPQVVWCKDNTTLYFYKGGRLSAGFDYKGQTVTASWSNTDVTESGGLDGDTHPRWIDYRYDGDNKLEGNVTTVVFDESFQDVLPRHLCAWFSGCNNLTTIEGIEYLNTSEAINMRDMFRNCGALTSLDVSHFDTRNVTDMSGMFYYCNLLTNLDVSGFNTSKVTDMSSMFAGCFQVKALDVSHFNTDNVTNMERMFESCSYNLTSLDVSSFNTSKVTNMKEMFRGCNNLTTIYGNDDWSLGVCEQSDNMFEHCENLVGGNGTVYDTNRLNVTYARPDNNDQQGYFTSAFVYDISSAGVGTLYMDYALNIPDADYFDVFYVKSVNSAGTLYLKKVRDVIPANTAVVIFGNEGSYSMSKSSESAAAIRDNMLQGVSVETSVEDLQQKHGKDIYVLSRGNDSFINFRKAGETVTSIPANRAYLPYTLASGARELAISFDEGNEASGIETIAAGNVPTTGVYTLSGQRVTNPQHGLYIVNGKKVLVP